VGLIIENLADSIWQLACSEPDLDRSTPGCLTPASETRLPGTPISPLAHDDSIEAAANVRRAALEGCDPLPVGIGFGIG
jgi:hypothetical protein